VKEPDRQIEIQLGHMCNNRCVFCVSGQRTGLGEAGPVPIEPLLERIRDAFGRGHRKITLLGGEPTLQPAFLPIVRECVALGFEEIVVFTNGAKTARGALVDEIRATGGNFTWRISIQGATREAHERTTRKDGSFGRILRTLEHLRDRGERITINMCVVGSNYASVDRFPELLARYGVSQLHLDLMRPLDAGVRTEDELRALMPPYSLMVEPLERMVRGFPPGFDVNIGNFPYCIAPSIAPFVHHDGEHTDTVAVDHKDELSRPWNKYEVKRRDKIKPDSCRACVFDSRCNGVFETYVGFHGTGELVPVTHERLVALDPDRRFFALHLRPLLSELAGWDVVERGVEEAHLALAGQPSPVLALRRARAGAIACYGDVAVHRLAPVPPSAAAAVEALHRTLAAHLRPIHPLGEDALGRAAASVAVRLARLRAAAPFGALVWREVALSKGGARAELALEGPAGERATVWLEETGRRATGGYELPSGAAPGAAIAEGLRAVMAAVAPAPSASLAEKSSPGY
jgi:MoaA/NifB/PqqE/SkfB family radical SAM enzyme